MLYQGKFRPQNPEKYDGDFTNIYYRSGWEFSVMRWCDTNPFVVEWSSEEFPIPYICKTDGRPHRYFIDLKIQFRDGRVFLIEIKPEKQTKPPQKRPKQHQRTYLNEVLTYTKNVSKWEAAKLWADSNGYKFNIWTEKDLTRLGIKMYVPKKAAK